MGLYLQGVLTLVRLPGWGLPQSHSHPASARSITLPIVPGHHRIALAPEVELLLLGLGLCVLECAACLWAATEELGIDHGIALADHLKVNVLATGIDLGHSAPEAVGIGFSELDS